MLYKVTIDFRKGAAFSQEIEAASPDEAKRKVREFAVQCGFTDPVKKQTAQVV